jgi:hypothetical protein
MVVVVVVVVWFGLVGFGVGGLMVSLCEVEDGG